MSTPVEDPAINSVNEYVSGIINEAKKKLEEFGSAIGKVWGSAGEALDTPAVALGAAPDASSISASSQSLYWSQQAGKVDVSVATASFDAFKVDESGISFMGAKIYEFPWVSKLENKFGTASASAKELKELEARFSTAEQTRTAEQGETNEIRTQVGDLKDKVSLVHKSVEKLSDKITVLDDMRKTYRQKKVGDANRWATRQWVDNRIKKGKDVGDRIKNDPAVARAGQDVEELARRVRDLEAAVGN
ncbi:hypothetical protein [Streptomyces sp. NPDC002588]|uniref:hypothetical protein n=1 Tax=Streptomyces sp. NPDC002588 TaxID=3154419 RepID=UPI003324D2C6